MKKKIKVLHVVKHFYAGGAERLLSGILQHSNKDRYEHVVLSLSDRNERLGRIHDAFNIEYKAIEIARNKFNFTNYFKCLLFIKKTKSDIIKTWLPPSNRAGGIMGRILHVPVIWGIHDARPVESDSDRIKQQQLFLSNKLPNRIICCSQAVYDTCIGDGYSQKLLEVITNGTDTVIFSPQPEGRKRIRDELRISDSSLLVGIAAEFVPLKRHLYFLAAARIFVLSHPDTQFLLCGRGTESDNAILNKYIQFLGMENHVHLLGIRDDMADIYSAMDIHTLCSNSESFGLAITEAMACKTLCVATDVGIIKDLLTNAGYIIPVSEDPNILADAWKHCIKLSKVETQKRLETGRNRIIRDYSLTKTAEQYDKLYSAVYHASQN